MLERIQISARIGNPHWSFDLNSWIGDTLDIIRVDIEEKMLWPLISD